MNSNPNQQPEEPSDSNKEDGVPTPLNQDGASNDGHFHADDSPLNLKTNEQVEAAGRLMSDAPADLPLRQDVFHGVSVAIRQLAGEIVGVEVIAEKLGTTLASDDSSAAHGATVLSLSRRKGRHLLFALLREVGLAVQAGRALDSSLLRTLGAWCLRRLLADYHPSSDTIAKLRQTLLSPAQRSGKAWSPMAQARCLVAALRGLHQAIKENPQAAERFGITQPRIWIAQSNSPVDLFNHAYRRRVENLIDFSTTNSVGAAGGYKTLAAGSLLVSGEELLSSAYLGDLGALLVCLESITHLPSETALLIPIQAGDTPPPGALAWFDLKNGKYCQVLYRLREKGGKPPKGREDLYEQTTHVVTIYLSTPLTDLLNHLMATAEGSVVMLADITGHVGHDPNSAVVGKGKYRATSRKIQESIPTILVQRGAYRWPVAVATNSHFLATRGRRAYGVCRASEIQRAMNQAYKLLGWPEAVMPESDELVGSLVTPKPASITTALNYLRDRADACSNSADGREQIVSRLNAHAEWLAMFLALALALRAWLIYKIPANELLAGDTALFDDKNIHEHKGPGVPVAQMLKSAVNGWYELCQSAVEQLEDLGDSESLALVRRIRAQLADKSTLTCIFTVDAIGRLMTVGHLTWMEALPEYILLLPNFARHFWPLRLMDLGIEQIVIDRFMRHQFDDLTPGSSHMLKISAKVNGRLRTAIGSVLSELGIHVPEALRSQAHV